ncbi:MAG: long-chain fatty acid--CoA ligase [Simplicispira suum]|uniref:AMP-dependent synthetase/ligase n=1 Tax=Simplicispira suum TaxID=2109915 RepID=UPI001C6AC09A|nr:long-chain fatty acid--CoA ligase [Simplicispira suum]MBW7834534.1 long-chain fatty acid--CoA ligase [Simplicispira suum]
MSITYARNAPLAASDSRFVSIPERLMRTAARQPTQAAYHVRDAAGWQPTSWEAYAAQVRQAARALVALGVQPGDAVCILGFNRPEWTTMDLAAMMVGGVAAGIYWSSAANEIAYIVEHSGCTVLLVENAQQWQKAACEPQALASLRATVMMRRAPTEAPAQAPAGVSPPMTWEAFMALGASLEHDAEVQRRLDAIQQSDTGTLIYTSGTTGHPKAVELSHANLSWTSAGLSAAFAVTPQDRLISYLPLAHVAEQMGAICNHVLAGYQVYFASSLETLGEHLQEVHPTIFFGVPRVWEKMQAAITSKLNAATGTKAALARWALGAGRDWHAKALKGQEPGAWLDMKKRLAGKLVHKKVQKALGFDQARILLSGAAPISVENLQFFTSLDLVIGEVYGQSEDSGPTAISLPGFIRIGAAGKPLPGVQVRIAEDGEILVKGPNVFVGYKGRPEATAETLQDGWLHSGDLGRIDKDGFIYVTGRKKDLLITSGGKNISPGNIEADLMNLPLVEHAIVVGDSRHYLAALLTLKPDVLRDFAQQRGLAGGLEAWCRSAEVRAELQRGVDTLNTRQARVAQVRKFSVIADALSIDNGCLTPTQKIRRNVVQRQYAAEIDALYRDEAVG